MKVLEIAGCNLASLKGEFRIALDKAPFSGEGLFAIRGATGSGKSTLIDAVCLALYDDTPRFVGKGGPEIGLPGQNDRLKATDPRGILHRGATQGWAEVIFKGIDGARWRARWSVAKARKKADGKFQPQDMELENLETGQRLGGTRSEVLEHIRQTVGLTFDQFRRSVLLAQGEFAAFAKAGQDERANLLEAMTGTGIYARISMAAQKRSAQEDQKLRDLHLQRNSLGMMSEDQRQEKALQLKNLETQIQEQEHGQAEALSGLAWYARAEHLAAQCQEAQQNIQIAEQALGEAEDRRSILHRVDQAQPLRALHVSVQQAQAHQISLTGQIQERQSGLPELELKKAAKAADLAQKEMALHQSVVASTSAKPDLEAARALDTRIQEGELHLRKLSQEADALEGEASKAEHERVRSEEQESKLTESLAAAMLALEETRACQVMAQSWPRIEKDLDDFAKATEELRQTRDSLQAVQDGLRKRQTEQTSLQQDREACESELTRLRARQEELGGCMAREPREALEMERNAGQVILNGLQQAQGVIQRLHPLLIQCVDTEAELQALEKVKNGHLSALNEAQQALPAAMAGLKEARNALERAQDALSLEERRACLVDGEPCPLCGSTVHPWSDGSPLNGLLDTLTERVSSLEDQRRRWEQTLASSQAKLDETAKAREKATRKSATATADLEKEEALWHSLRAQIPGLPENGRVVATQTEVRSALLDAEDRLADLKQRSAALLDLEKQAEQCLHTERETDKKRAKLDEKLRQILLEIQGLEVKAAELGARASHFESRLGELRVALTPVLEAGVWIALDQNPGVQKEKLAEKVSKRLSAEASHQKTSEQLTQVTIVLGRQRAVASEKRSMAQAGADKRDEAARAVKDLQQQRQLFFEGQSAQSVEHALEARCRQWEEAVKQASKDVEYEERALGDLSQAIATLQEQLNQAQKALEAARSRFNEALARQWAGGLSDLEACLAWTTEQIQREREALQALDTACNSARAVLDTHQKAMQEHLATEKSALEKETLEKQSADLKQTLDELKRSQGGLMADLQRNDLAMQHAQALAVTIQNQEAQTSLWAEMNSLVGSSDGKKLRTFAQSLTLELLLAFANEQLGRLTPRYRLQRVPNCELEIQVIDRDMGDEVRALNSLSGGETFLVSLALALGLSSLSASDTPIESLVIDEGFGTLDTDTLETALSVLDELQSQGRQIGIISHVEGLATHIPVQVRVEKLGGGKSRVIAP